MNEIPSFLVTIVAGFIFAIFAPFLHKLVKDKIGWVMAILPLSLFVFYAQHIPYISNGRTVVQRYPWVSSLDIDFVFYLDGLSLLMTLLITGIGTLVFIYTGGYLHHDKNLGRFFLFLTAFMSAMLGVVLSGNILLLFIFWEITSIMSYLLIGYKHTYADSRESARQALIITGGGGLALLAGLIFVGHSAGTYDLVELVTGDYWLGNNPLYMAGFVLVAIGAFTKSAQVPFHFWLPGAMAAPTPVSSYLHSATMVKAGVYLLARLTPVLGMTVPWFYVVTGFGALTMFIGAYLSWQNQDLKKILAYSTISVLGTLVMLLGLGARTEYALKALVIFLLAHALYKGCLFMVAGSIDHETGTRDIAQLSGLRHKMPITFAAALVAALSKAGLPLFLGFIGKELLYEATLHSPYSYGIWGLTILTVVCNSMVGVSAALIIIRPFLGKEVIAPKEHVHEAPISMWLGPVVLSICTLALGCLPFLLDDFSTAVAKSIAGGDQLLHHVVQTTGVDALEAAEASSHGEDSHYGGPLDMHLAIYHGLKMVDHGVPTPLFWSIITIGLLGLLYRVRDKLVPVLLPLRGDKFGSQQWYKKGFHGVLECAEWITLFLQNGKLRWYIGIIISTFTGLLFYTIYRSIHVADWFPWEQIKEGVGFQYLFVYLLLGIIAFGAIYTMVAPNRTYAIASLGVVGFGIAILFVIFQAPDLAMTQFAIEILSVVLIALIMRRLPTFTAHGKKSSQVPAFIIAGLAGILMTVLVWLTLLVEKNSQLTTYFVENSKTLAHGKNIVNVILVDFRGFDTFGEITVLAIAGIGVYAISQLTASSYKKEKKNKR